MSEPLITDFSENAFLCEENLEEPPGPQAKIDWVPVHIEYLKNLYITEPCYFPDQRAFTRQNEITESMRSILLDWIMELCSEFYLKRETFYLAVSHIDRLISETYISRNDFQLIGISALYLASKTEEIEPPKIFEFVKAADRTYPANSIISMEKKILKTLKWKIFPSTPYQILNVILLEWDNYISILFQEYIDYVNVLSKEKIKQQDLLNKRLETFKKENTYSYKRFREISQILDACCLEFSIYRFSTASIIGALLYLMVNRGFYYNKYELIWWNSLVLGFDVDLSDPQVMQTGTKTVHFLLETFLCKMLNIVSIDGLSAQIFHLNKFLQFTFCYKLPPASNKMKNIQENYENFLSFQTHNSTNLKFLSIFRETKEFN